MREVLYFVITVPYNKNQIATRKNAGGEAAVHPAPAAMELQEETAMANEKILVVDDDQNICELLRL